jgi:transcriptional regulator NrdR family protein
MLCTSYETADNRVLKSRDSNYGHINTKIFCVACRDQFFTSQSVKVVYICKTSQLMLYR